MGITNGLATERKKRKKRSPRHNDSIVTSHKTIKVSEGGMGQIVYVRRKMKMGVGEKRTKNQSEKSWRKTIDEAKTTKSEEERQNVEKLHETGSMALLYHPA